MNNSKNIKLLCCIFGSFMLTLIQKPLFFQAIYTVFGGGTGANSFTELLYNVIGIVSFAGAMLFIIFSIMLIISNIKFNDK